VKPAAVELHTTMDLLCDAPPTVVLTPDTASEQAFLPEPASLRASVLLADRGSLDLHYLRRVQEEGGFFLIRAKAGMNPHVVEAFREDGKRLRSLRNKPLKAIHAKLPKRQRVELGVQWQIDGHPLCLRLILSWNPRTKSFCSFLTNLPPKRYPLEVICRAYKWRWQVEISQPYSGSREPLSLTAACGNHEYRSSAEAVPVVSTSARRSVRRCRLCTPDNGPPHLLAPAPPHPRALRRCRCLSSGPLCRRRSVGV
jgi:hypothetical protein